MHVGGSSCSSNSDSDHCLLVDLRMLVCSHARARGGLGRQDAKKKMLSETDTNKRESADDDIRRKAEVDSLAVLLLAVSACQKLVRHVCVCVCVC